MGKWYILHPQKIQSIPKIRTIATLHTHKMCVQLKLLPLKYTPECDPLWELDMHVKDPMAIPLMVLYKNYHFVCITYQLRCFADRLGLPIVNYWCQSLHKTWSKEKNCQWLKPFPFMKFEEIKKILRAKTIWDPIKLNYTKGDKKETTHKEAKLLLYENLVVKHFQVEN